MNPIQDPVFHVVLCHKCHKKMRIKYIDLSWQCIHCGRSFIWVYKTKRRADGWMLVNGLTAGAEGYFNDRKKSTRRRPESPRKNRARKNNGDTNVKESKDGRTVMQSMWR